MLGKLYKPTANKLFLITSSHQIDHEKLAEGLQRLPQDDLLHVVQMIHEHKTPESYTKNDVERKLFQQSSVVGAFILQFLATMLSEAVRRSTHLWLSVFSLQHLVAVTFFFLIYFLLI
jgi:hypothetical protein